MIIFLLKFNKILFLIKIITEFSLLFYSSPVVQDGVKSKDKDTVQSKFLDCIVCGEPISNFDPDSLNDAVTCAKCKTPGLSLQVDSDGAKVLLRREYHCNLCYKYFSTKDRLEFHIMRHSENMDEFICSTCGKKLSTEQALFEHHLFVHKGARPHVCELCGKQYLLLFFFQFHFFNSKIFIVIHYIIL